MVFVGVVCATTVAYLRLTDAAYFGFDDWRLILEAGSLEGIVEPYNDHLSITILAVYRALVEVFGFSYTPFRVVGLLCLAGVPLAFYVTTRRSLGPLLAALAGLSLLAFGNIELYPAVLNHHLALIGGIGCAAALPRGRRADGVLAACLVLSLSAAGGGVAVAAACVVHSAWTQAPRRRWLAVVGPCALWCAWWLVVARGHSSEFRPAARPSAAEAVSYAGRVLWTPFEHVGLGVPALSVLVAVLFVAAGVARMGQGRRAAAGFVAWTTASAVWAIGLALGRGATGIDGQDVVFRYQLTALAFALLASVPSDPPSWASARRIGRTTSQAAGAAVLLLGIIVVALSIRETVGDTGALLEATGRNTRAQVLVLELGPGVIPDEQPMSVVFFGLRAAEVRGLVARYGAPFEADAASIDAQIVAVGAVPTRFIDRPNRPCTEVDAPFPWLPRAHRHLYLWSDQDHWTVEVRRFGADWVSVVDAVGGQTVVVAPPRLAVDGAWEVRATGACRAGGPPLTGT